MQSIIPLDSYRFHGRLQPFRYLYGLAVCATWSALGRQCLAAARRVLTVEASRSPQAYRID